MADSTNNIETTYKNVEFDFRHVNLLWNCCAIVKKLLKLQEEVDLLNQKLISLPDDFSDFMQETRDGLEAAANGIVDLNKSMQRVLAQMSQVETDVSKATTAVNNMEALVSNLQTTVDNMKTAVDGLTLRVTAVEGQASTNAGNITALQTRVNNLGTAANKGVANNLTQATSGVNVLDAYQGKLLNDRVDTLAERIPRGVIDRFNVKTSIGNTTSASIKFPVDNTAYGPGLLMCGNTLWYFSLNPTGVTTSQICGPNTHTLTALWDAPSLTYFFNINFNTQICVILGGTASYRATIDFS